MSFHFQSGKKSLKIFQKQKHTFFLLKNDMDTFMGSSESQSLNQKYSKNNPPNGGLFCLIFPPPISQGNESLRQILSKGREAIARVGSVFEEYSSCYEFSETISEDLGVGFSDIFPDFCESTGTVIDSLQYKKYPLFPKESEKSLSMWAATLRRSNHIGRYRNF